jgi:hypothetical protein
MKTSFEENFKDDHTSFTADLNNLTVANGAV